MICLVDLASYGLAPYLIVSHHISHSNMIFVCQQTLSIGIYIFSQNKIISLSITKYNRFSTKKKHTRFFLNWYFRRMMQLEAKKRQIDRMIWFPKYKIYLKICCLKSIRSWKLPNKFFWRETATFYRSCRVWTIWQWIKCKRHKSKYIKHRNWHG